jgi:hypothetical protein
MSYNEKLTNETISHSRDELVLASNCVVVFKDGKRFLDSRPEAIMGRIHG